MGQKKRPGAQERGEHHNTQHGAGANAKKTRPHAGPGEAASAARHAASGEGPDGSPLDARQNGSGRAVGGNQAQGG